MTEEKTERRLCKRIANGIRYVENFRWYHKIVEQVGNGVNRRLARFKNLSNKKLNILQR